MPGAAQMLMDLGPNVYQEDFEQHFLAKAAEFYQVCRLPSGSICAASLQAAVGQQSVALHHSIMGCIVLCST